MTVEIKNLSGAIRFALPIGNRQNYYYAMMRNETTDGILKIKLYRHNDPLIEKEDFEAFINSEDIINDPNIDKDEMESFLSPFTEFIGCICVINEIDNIPLICLETYRTLIFEIEDLAEIKSIMEAISNYVTRE